MYRVELARRKLQQQIERIGQLPKAKQRFVMEMLETVLAQASREREVVMTTVEVKLNLPDQIAQEAKRAGLLNDRAIERLIEEAVRREAGKKTARCYATIA